MRNTVLKLLAAAVLLFAAAGAAEADNKTFNQPNWKGDRLDWCLNWSQGCGKAAADAYCQASGYQNATDFAMTPDIGTSQKTRLISTGAVCDQDFCDGFKYISCFKPAPATVVINQPKWKGDRLDWCMNWSQGCGKDAADAYCKASGYQNVINFAMAADIGSTHQTRLISTGAVCDQDFCDGFKFIECKQ